MPSVSIVLAAYNGERYIKEQLRSLVEQSESPLEILVSDDGSTDSTEDIVRTIAQQSNIPIYYHKNDVNVGYANNFLNAVCRAKGDLIAFCDQDDVWQENKLERCVRPFNDDKVSICVHAACLIDENGVKFGEFPQGILKEGIVPFRDLNPWGVYWGFSMVFRRSLLSLFPSDRRGPDLLDKGKHLAHDRWVYFLATLSGEIYGIPEPLVGYRQHSSNLFGSGDARKSRSKLSLLVSNIKSSTAELELLRVRGALYAESARIRFEIADQLLAADGASGIDLERLNRARILWQSESTRAEARLNLYNCSSNYARILAWFRSMFTGKYTRKFRCRDGVKAALRDLSVAIF